MPSFTRLARALRSGARPGAGGAAGVGGEAVRKIKGAFGEKRGAITELDKLAAAMAQTNIVRGQIPPALESALEMLRQLTDQTALYDQEPIEFADRPLKEDP